MSPPESAGHDAKPAHANGQGGRSNRVQDIDDAALTLFAERGYRATTVKDIAEAVGIQAPSLYSHVGSKEEILKHLMRETMDQLLADFEEAISDVTDPAEQLARGVAAHVRYHARHPREALVGNREIRSLSSDPRLVILRKRDEYEAGFRALIERGAEEGRFQVDSTRLASYAILEMGIGVAGWYRPDGPLDEDRVVRNYTDFALRLVGLPASLGDDPKAAAKARVA